MTDTPRLQPLPTEKWGASEVDALRGAFPDSLVDSILQTGHAPNVLGTMLHHPALSGPFNVFGNVLLQQPTIGHRNRELMLLCVAWRTGARYEWVHHALLAERYGVTDKDIDAITTGIAADSWATHERDLVAAANEMLDNYRIADDTWNRLAEHFSERQLVEIPMTVGAYTALAMAFNSWNLQVEDGVQTDSIPLPPLRS
jgi:4-carboxymuconolactone decarboxylase